MALATPEFLQTKQYSAKTVRDALLDTPLQNGVVASGDLLVSQRGAGASMSVDLAAGSGWVIGQTAARQGIYHLYNDAIMNISIAGNASGNPRLDQIVLHVYDSVDGAAAQDSVQLEVIQGSPNASATLSSRAGAASLPATSLLLGDVLVANGAASITNAAIRDRRGWAKGAYGTMARTVGSTNISTTSTAYVEIDVTNLKRRFELSGRPLRVNVTAQMFNGTAGFNNWATIGIDGVAVSPDLSWHSSRAGNDPLDAVFLIDAPSPGSHTVSLMLKAESGSTLQLDSTSGSVKMVVEEVLRDNAVNNPAGYG